VQTVDRYVFLLYALGGLFLFLSYRRLELPAIPIPSRTPLATSRHNVTRLSILFSIDAFGGGFVVQSMLVLWLGRRFDMSSARIGSLLFVTGILSAFSILLAPKVAKRFGLVRTMVFTHIPASIFLIAAAFMPNAPLAIACLILRSLVSSMDVPARTSYVMAIVPANERAAAASVTNVPRSLAAALPPLATGAMLDHSNFGWPLLLAGIIKITYDLLLLFQFRSVRPPEER
jgi:predicted MFS family arabinose efflux permease